MNKLKIKQERELKFVFKEDVVSRLDVFSDENYSEVIAQFYYWFKNPSNTYNPYGFKNLCNSIGINLGEEVHNLTISEIRIRIIDGKRYFLGFKKYHENYKQELEIRITEKQCDKLSRKLELVGMLLKHRYYIPFEFKYKNKVYKFILEKNKYYGVFNNLIIYEAEYKKGEIDILKKAIQKNFGKFKLINNNPYSNNFNLAKINLNLNKIIHAFSQ